MELQHAKVLVLVPVQIQQATAFQGQCLLRDRSAALVHAFLRLPPPAARSGRGGHKRTSSSATKQGTSQFVPTRLPNSVEASLCGAERAPWQKIDILGVARIAAGGGYASLDVFTAAVKESASAVLAAVNSAAAFGEQSDSLR